MVTRAEFRAALASMGFHMTDFEFDRFFRLFDADNVGEISYNQFRETVGEVIQPTERRRCEMRPRAHQPGLLEWIMRTIKQSVDHRFTSIDQAQALLDSNTNADGE